jgi:uncharacterized protein YkwD
MFDKLTYNREYSKLYYLKMKQKKLQLKNNIIDNDIMAELTKVKRPQGNLALQKKRLARELKKNAERVAEYRAKNGLPPLQIDKPDESKQPS